MREQSPLMCKDFNPEMTCDLAKGQHLITTSECAKIYTDDNFQIIGEARSYFHLEGPVYMKRASLVYRTTSLYCNHKSDGFFS